VTKNEFSCDTCRISIYKTNVKFKHIQKCRLVVVVNVDEVRRPPTGLLFISQMIYEYGEPRWNDIDRGNRRTWR
jgi:hypothetical protein